MKPFPVNYKFKDKYFNNGLYYSIINGKVKYRNLLRELEGFTAYTLSGDYTLNQIENFIKDGTLIEVEE
jgi:hypothetical protein